MVTVNEFLKICGCLTKISREVSIYKPAEYFCLCPCRPHRPMSGTRRIWRVHATAQVCPEVSSWPRPTPRRVTSCSILRARVSGWWAVRLLTSQSFCFYPYTTDNRALLCALLCSSHALAAVLLTTSEKKNQGVFFSFPSLTQLN